jgi:hypothetical protein
MRRVVLLIVLALVATGSAAAKEGIEATILSPIPKDAAAGSTVHVEWRLAELNSGKPFGAGGIFILRMPPPSTLLKGSRRADAESPRCPRRGTWRRCRDTRLRRPSVIQLS